MTDKSPKTILIVEDEKPLKAVLGEALEKEGFVTEVAVDGQSGLNSALKNHPDLILLDIYMPKMNGVEMLAALREDSWGKNVPVLLLTNDINPEDIRETLKHNAADYLIKADWKIADVIERIKTALKM